VSAIGKLVADESIRLRAAHEYRMQSELFRKLTGADIVVKDPTAEDQAALDEAMTYVRDLSAKYKALEMENLILRGQLAQREGGQLQPTQIVG